MSLSSRLIARVKRILGLEKELSFDEQMKKQIDETIANFRRNGVLIGEGCYLHGVQIGEKEPVEIGNDCVLTYCTILGHDAAPVLFLKELHEAGLIDPGDHRFHAGEESVGVLPPYAPIADTA